MKFSIQKTLNHGHPVYRLNIAPGPWGGRQRKFFPTEAEAKRFAREFEERIERDGARAAPVGIEETHALARWLKTFTLAELEGLVAEAAARKAHGNVTVSEAAEHFLEASRLRGSQARHLSDLKSRLGAFRKTFGGRPIGSLRGWEIEDWLHKLPFAPETRKNYLKIIRSFFVHAEGREWLGVNPAGKLKAPELPQRDPQVFSAGEMSAMLRFADLPSRWFLILGGFAGMRTSEILRLDAAQISLEENHIWVSHLKTSKRGMRDRYIDLTENLRAWIEFLGLPESGRLLPFTDRGFRHRLKRALRAAKVKQWPKNGLRDTFCSCHLAAFDNAGLTAAQAGHTNPATTFAHYRKLRTREQGKAWFAITPESVMKGE